MDWGELFKQLVSVVIVGGVATIGFFLKRVINKTDTYDNELEKIKTSYVSKSDVNVLEEKFSKEIEKLESDTKNEISKVHSSINDSLKTISKDIKNLQLNSISKNDLHRQMTGYESKMDKLLDLILEGRR